MEKLWVIAKDLNSGLEKALVAVANEEEAQLYIELAKTAKLCCEYRVAILPTVYVFTAIEESEASGVVTDLVTFRNKDDAVKHMAVTVDRLAWIKEDIMELFKNEKSNWLKSGDNDLWIDTDHATLYCKYVTFHWQIDEQGVL